MVGWLLYKVTVLILVKSELMGLMGLFDGFGGLVVSMLASGIRLRGFKPDWIFRASENSSACLPSEGK